MRKKRKQRKQIYAAAICICMVLSLTSAPVSAAEKEDAHVCSEGDGCITKKEDCHYESKNGSTSAAGEMKQENKDGGEAGQEAESGKEAGREAESGKEAGQEAESGKEAGQKTENGKEAGLEAENGKQAGLKAENGEQTGLEAENGEDAELETEIEEALNEQKAVSVESVQDMIDALPDAEKISADNAEEVAMQLEAIDKAKVQLSDEELDQLDFTRYTEVIDALGELSKPVLTANGSGDVATAEEMKAAIGDGSISTVKMTADITLDATLIVDRMVTLDLNGCMLKGSGGSVIKVEEGGALNIEDNNWGGSKSRKFKPDGNGLWKLDENGTESISGGIITGGTGTPMGPVGLTYGGGICVAPGGSLLMTGGTIVGCTAKCGGGVGLYGDSKKSAQFAMMSINNSRIIGCTADSGGGVNINEYADFSMDSGSITNCTANNGGGITLDSGSDNSCGSVTITGGEIRNCKAEHNGGGISNDGKVTMLGGVIADCTLSNSYGAGGTIMNFGDGTLFLSSGGTISGGGTNGVYNIGRLLGCGGTIDSEVLNEGKISGIEGHTDLDTQFNSKVTNSGSISGGRYNGDVKNDGGEILGGNFSGSLNGTLTITFDADNGESPTKQSIAWSKAGKMLAAPAPDPVKDGYTFDGWYYDNHGTETKWDFAADAAKYTMTLTAKWTQNSAPVTPVTPAAPTASGNTESGNGRRHRSRRSSGGNAYTGAAKTNSSQTLYRYTGINPFADVYADDWFYNDVMFAYEKGLMTGIYADSFLPHGNTSRAEIAVILYRLEDSPAVEGRNSFTDMEYGADKVWYYDMVTWAQQNGIMDGSGDGRFGAGEPLTREELVSILYRYAKVKGYDVTGTEKPDSFTDRSDVSDWAQEAMTWAVSRGIINDRGNNLLEPKGAATRAEVAVMLHRFIEKYELQPAVTPAGTIGWIKQKEE